MDTMFGYMTEFERELAIIESVIDNKLMKLNYEFDKLMMEHTENLIAIENKVMMESGTDKDLEMLYMAEAEEVKKEGQGILGKLVATVRAFFKKIKEFLFGKKIEEENLPEEVEVPEDPSALKKQGNELLNNIRSFFSGKKGALRAAGIAIAAAGGVVLTKKKIIPTIKDLNEFIDESEKTMAQAEGKVNNTDMSPEDQNMLKKALNQLKALGTRASKIVKAAGSEGFKDFKDKKLVAAADAAYTKVEDMIKAGRENITKIDDTMVKLQKEISELEKKAGNKDSIISRFRNQNAKDAHRLDVLKDKLAKKGQLTDAERAEYNRLSSMVSSMSGSISSKISKMEKLLSDLAAGRAKLEKQIEKFSSESIKASDKKAKASGRLAGHDNVSIDGLLAKATAILGGDKPDTIGESVDEMIATSNAEIDYFMNSLL